MTEEVDGHDGRMNDAPQDPPGPMQQIPACPGRRWRVYCASPLSANGL